MRSQLRNIIEDHTSKGGRIFDSIIQFLIFSSLLAYAINTLPNNTPETKYLLRKIETISVIIFTIEYVLRIYVAKKPIRYIFSFYGIIDLLAILPFFISNSTHLLSLRAFRALRIFRAFKLVRYNKALNRFSIAYRLVREEMILFLTVAGIFLFLASAGIYYFENPIQPKVFASIFHSAWWAIVTLTTVGYGDIYPITIGGRVFTFFILLIGVGIVTIPAGLVASALTEARKIEAKIQRN
ncbi:ion transporter [Candidatus Nitrosacidococcus tergens]|uniref:Ion transport protein n=1 Tax=Candidatus Nitrosacidococcus tergens TaxID=553981 RepID=A0A7G1Q9J6_9GAMM|nr:ion transporter [Candidatus Nitrosacidococcus tergens]CAB1275779.1 Ion transport protein [Candidatus Nitrosacidococcus tergens]